MSVSLIMCHQRVGYTVLIIFYIIHLCWTETNSYNSQYNELMERSNLRTKISSFLGTKKGKFFDEMDDCKYYNL